MTSLRAVAALALGLSAGSCGPSTPPASPSPPSFEPAPPTENTAEPATPPAPATPAAPVSASTTETLVLDGTPEIPEALRQRLNQYLNTRSAGLSDISASGDALLVSTRFGETTQVHLVKSPLGAREQLTFALEPTRSPTFVPGDPSRVLFAADSGGDEKRQIFVLDRESGATTRITDGKSVNRSFVFSRDGKHLAVMSNRRNGKDFDIWLHAGATAAGARLLVEADGYFFPVGFSGDGSQLLVGEYISINQSHLHLVDVATGKRRQLDDAKVVASNDGGPFARDGKSVFVASDRDGEFMQIYRVDLAAGSWTSITSDLSWNAESMALSADGRTLAFTVNEGGVSRLYLYDTRTKKRKVAANVPAGIISGLRFADKAAVLGFTLGSAARSSDAYTYDVRRSRLTRWTESEMGGLNTKRFVEPTLVKLKSFDGLEVPAFYYRPVGKGPFPVVISIHGGPESQARPRFSAFTQFLVAESKIAVLVPNVRGSAGYGKSYLKLDNGMKREDSVKDIGALLDWVGAREELDGERACVFGGSYGGYMVLASLVHFSKRLVCGVDVVGISNFVTFLENTADYRRDLRRAEYGDERDKAMRAHLETISPLRRAKEIKSALFVAQGANDPRVPASEAEQIIAAVRGSGNDAWYMLARDEGHGFAKRKNSDTFLLLSMLFLEKHLLGK